ncbi:putative glycolipid-binding domain-containing protein [Deinococcus sp.]|uniref:putative glycolipid-binding domain-containing protein n=1 Tax=Deinococcus sp. TaxID=47478 RepID=UPI0025E1EAE5|nr:putative glycolipid-binding domain-containing protein [Deinococcus sp.]
MSDPASPLLWRSLNPDAPTLEHLRLLRWSRAEGTVVGRQGGHAFALKYELDLGDDGCPTILDLQVAGGAAMTIYRSKSGVWSSASGHRLSKLEHCTDLDLRVTPITNTLALRRLKLGVGQSGDLLAAWVNVPDLSLRAVRQRYTRTAEQTYRYKNLESGFTSELRVDDDLLVLTSSDAYERA